MDIPCVLWQAGASTVRQDHEALDKGNGYTTTLLDMQPITENEMLTRF